MAFLLGGEVSLEHPGMTCRRVRAWILRTARQGGPERGFPGCSGTDPGGIQMGRIPIGGIIWYFQSIR